MIIYVKVAPSSETNNELILPTQFLAPWWVPTLPNLAPHDLAASSPAFPTYPVAQVFGVEDLPREQMKEKKRKKRDVTDNSISSPLECQETAEECGEKLHSCVHANKGRLKIIEDLTDSHVPQCRLAEPELYELAGKYDQEFPLFKPAELTYSQCQFLLSKCSHLLKKCEEDDEKISYLYGKFVTESFPCMNPPPKEKKTLTSATLPLTTTTPMPSPTTIPKTTPTTSTTPRPNEIEIGPTENSIIDVPEMANITRSIRSSSTSPSSSVGNRLNTNLYTGHEWYDDTNLKTVSFRQKGRMVGGLNFAHILYDFDLAALIAHTDKFCNEIQSVEAVPSNDFNKYVKEMIQDYHKECLALKADLLDVSELWYEGAERVQANNYRNIRSTANTVGRHKRQLLVLGAVALVAGAVAAYSYFFSDRTLADISIGSQTSPATIKLLQQDEVKITVDENSIKILNETMRELGEAELKLRKEMQKMQWLHRVEQQFYKLRGQVKQTLEGLEKLHAGRMSSALIKPAKLREILNKMRINLGTVHLKMMLTDVEQFFQAETSYLVFQNRTIRAITHLPIYRSDSLLDLMEFVPVPFPIGEKHFLEIKPERTLLAINSKNTLYRTLNALELSLCHQIDHLYYCKHSNNFMRGTHESCLFFLYTRNVEKVMETCKFSLNIKSDRLVQLSNEKVVIFHEKEKVAVHHCEPSDLHEEKISFAGFKTFILKPGCRVQTPDFVMEGSTQIFLQADEIVSTDIDVMGSDLVLTLETHLGSYLNQLARVGSKKDLKIRDINGLFAHETIGFHVKIGLFGTVVVVVLLVAVAYAYHRCCGGRNILACCLWCCKRTPVRPIQNESQLPFLPPQSQAIALQPMATAPVQPENNEAVAPDKSFNNPAGTYNALYTKDVNQAT